MKHDFIDKYSDLNSPVHRLNARIKIIFLSLLIVANVSTPAKNYFAFALYLVILGGITAFSKVPLEHILRKSMVIIPFVVMISIFLPFIKTSEISGGISLGISAIQIYPSKLLLLWNVLIKSFLSVVALILLSSTTGFADLLKGLRSLGMPQVLLNMFNFFYRYIFVLVEEVQRVKRARDARCFRGKTLKQALTIGNMIGIIFLRSFERGERVFSAMCARGYDGKIVGSQDKSLSFQDYAILSLGIIIILIIRLGI
jgi:cobalt/nickel transport system permease protein